MAATWVDLLAAAFGGGLGVKLLDWLWAELTRRRETTRTATQLLDRHMDPLLKSADEVVGKLRSLAADDFRTFSAAPPSATKADPADEVLELAYLLSQFWARTQILREESVYVNIGSTVRGRQLLGFLNAFEAQRTRLVLRACQRAAGEALVVRGGSSLRAMTYQEFLERYCGQPVFCTWFSAVVSLLRRLKHTRERQALLAYGALLHALIDTLDREHLVTRDRPSWPNKLSDRTRRELRHRVFGVYLPYVTNPERYYQPSRPMGAG